MAYKRSTAKAFACLLLAMTWGHCPAQGIIIEPGATLSLGDGQVNLGCGDLEVGGLLSVGPGMASGIRNINISGGTVEGGSGLVSLAGNWTNGGAFTAGTGEVRVVDGCSLATSSLSGDTDFHDFSVTSASGKLLSVAAGSSQFFASSLTLEGVLGNLLRIRSSAAGQQVFFSLAVGGAQSIFAIDVQDNDASGGRTLAPGAPEDYDSVDSGNNENWFIDLMDLIFKDGFET